MAMASERFLVTGALGCIGSWVLRHLVRSGVEVIATDLSTDPVRPRLIMSDDELSRVRFATLDVTDLDAVRDMVEREGVTRVVHLAGLQIPFCYANPSLGAAVNVQGTVNIFEAVRHAEGQVRGLSYASSLAVLGPASMYPERPLRDDIPLHPGSLYGVYKQANEGTARLFWESWQVPSVGLRPYIVYGVGRDQGMTSDPTKAMLAVAAGRPFQIQFSGEVGMQYAPDVAAIFVASAMADYHGSGAFLLRGSVVTMEEIVAAIAEVEPRARELIDVVDNPLPLPADLSDDGLRGVIDEVPHTPLRDATRDTMERFSALVAAGTLA
ncbi:MAG TPA: NAD(P)-dependent oxidoreductase [Thermomicrobiales bacterium]|nr:NAD(P)-dependent oxidoreductase [Thermomicrobiales bacterium]